MKTHKLATLCIGIVALAGVPASALAASLQITEVMYDPPGTGGAQWIELYNLDTSSVVMTAGTKGWRVDDGASSKHLLVDPASANPSGGRGTLTIAAGGFAIITNDPTGFIAQYGDAPYSVIKSAIAPKTAGATISLLSADGAVVDSVSYVGGKGAPGDNDGNSLHRSGGAFVAAPPDPGVFAEASAPAQNSPTDSSTTPPADASAATQTTASDTSSSGGDVALPATTQTQLPSIPNTPPLAARITALTAVAVGAGSTFSGMALGTKGDPIENARYLWNFGDGATSEGQKVFHTYMYPGHYALVLTVSSGYSMGTSYATIEALPAQVVLQTQSDGSAVLSNQSAQNINVGLWSIHSGAESFTIPENTVVLAKQSVHFSSAIINLLAGGTMALYYPNGMRAATSTEAQIISTAPATSVNSVVARAVSLLAASASATTAPVPGQHTASPADLSASVVEATTGGSTSPILWESLLGLGALVALGVAGAWYARAPFLLEQSQTISGHAKEHETLAADDFSIDEL